MNRALPNEARQEISALLKILVEKHIVTQAENYGDFLALWQELHAVYREVSSDILRLEAGKFSGSAVSSPSPEKFEADSVSIEAVDKNTGSLIRRDLPIQYTESDNGLILSGETFEGKPSHIAFFSDSALSRMKDILGKGPDTHRCGND